MRTLPLLAFLLLLSIASASAQPLDRPPLTTEREETLVENRGQWDRRARFMADIGGARAWITDSGVTWDFPAGASRRENDNRKGILTNRNAIKQRDVSPRDASRRRGHVIAMKFAGASREAHAQGMRKAPGIRNYYRGNDPGRWVEGARTYRETILRNLYDGIDARIYFDEGSIRYDLIVAPGADPERIAIEYDGAEKVSVNRKGDLLLGTSLGDVEMKKLYAYQIIDGKERAVECSFSVGSGNLVRFALGDYIASYPLVIDPLLYSTFLGSPGDEEGLDIDVDANGNAYVTGIARSSDFPTTPGAYDRNYRENDDIFISRLSADGRQLLYSTFIGGSGEDWGRSIAVASTGIVCVTGTTASVDLPITAGSLDGFYHGKYDACVLKLNLTGGLLFSTFLGGSDRDEGFGIAVGTDGSVYIAGSTTSADFSGDFPPVGAFDSQFNGDNDAFLVKLDPTGSSIDYATYLGGSLADDAYGIALDGSGAAYVMGVTRSTDFPVTAGAYDETHNGNFDLFVTKFSPSGNALSYSTYIGGNDGEGGGAIAVDQAGSAYIVGSTRSANYPTTPGAFDRAHGGEEMAVTKLAVNGGSLSYSTFLGEILPQGFAISVDRNGAACVTGATQSDKFPTTPNGHDQSYNGGGDVIVAKLNPLGSGLLYSSYLGGAGAEIAVGSTLDNTGTIYIAGRTTSSDYPTTTGAYDVTYNSNQDAFVTAIGLCDLAVSVGNDTIICAGEPATLYSRVTGASGPVTYEWSEVSTNKVIGASAGLVISPSQTETYRLKVTAQNCTQTVAMKVTVTQRPAPPTVEPETICAGLTATISAQSAPGATARWFAVPTDGPPLFTGNSYTTPALTATTTYYVDAQADGSQCASTTRTPVTVTVHPRPTLGPQPDVTICQGEPVTLTVDLLPSSNILVRWFTTPTGGVPVAEGKTHPPATLAVSTTFYLEATDITTGCVGASRTTLFVRVVDRPLPPVAPSVAACDGEPVTLKAEQVAGLNYRWYDAASGGNQLGNGAGFIPPPPTGTATFYVESIDAATGCVSASRTEVTVTIGARPTPVISGQSSACEKSLPISYGVPASAGRDYQWTVSANGQIVGGQGTATVNVQWNGSGTSTLSVRETDIASGCFRDTTLEVTVSSSLAPLISTSGSTTLCEGDSVVLDAGPGYVDYLWSNTATTRTITVKTPGIYTVNVSDAGGCKGSSAEVTVTIFPRPAAPTISQRTDTLEATAGSDVVRFRWLLEGVEIPGETDRELITTTKGQYSVIAVNAQGCGSESAPFEHTGFGVASAEVVVEPRDLTGEIGAVVGIPIILRNPVNLGPAKADEFILTVRFDRRLLMPLGSPGTVQGNDRTVSISGRLRPGNDTMAVLPAVALLGELDRTPIDIVDVEWKNAEVETTGSDGTFTVTGFCETGDRRLVRTGSGLKMIVRPNPVAEEAGVQIDLAEDGPTRLTLVSSLGEEVRTLHDGTARHGRLFLPLDLRSLPNGAYYLLLRTPTETVVERLELRR